MEDFHNDFEAFSREYQKEEKEILILTEAGEGGSMFKKSWSATKYFLAYFDIASNELKDGKGRVNWLISEEDEKQHGFYYPYYFKDYVIYHLKVKELTDKSVPEGMSPSFYNSFLVIDIINENVNNDELLAILDEYEKPIKISDDVLGEFELEKDYAWFTGLINWQGEDTLVYVEVNIDNKDSWTKAMNVLHTLFEQQKQKDLEFRTFAAEELTDVANDWSQDDDEEISKTDFINRISLSELLVDSDGSYTAYFDDDDIFFGHAIVVHGNIKKGIEYISIEG